MKDFYTALILISMVCMSGNSDSVVAWVIWETTFLIVILFCEMQIAKLEDEEKDE